MLRISQLPLIALSAAAMLYGGLAYTNNSNPSSRLTGAPGESNCDNCHGGTATSNPAKLQISTVGGITAFAPGQLVPMNVKIVGAGAKNGFELTVRNNANAAFGTLVVTSATQMTLATTGGKGFLKHSTGGNRLSSWNFSWQAPAARDTLSAIFYAAAVQSNNNNREDAGDLIFLAQHRLPAQRLTATEKQVPILETGSVRLFPNPCAEAVHVAINLAKPAPVVAALYNTAGVLLEQRTFFMEAGAQTIRWDFDSKPITGTYIVRLTAGGFTTARKLTVE